MRLPQSRLSFTGPIGPRAYWIWIIGAAVAASTNLFVPVFGLRLSGIDARGWRWAVRGILHCFRPHGAGIRYDPKAPRSAQIEFRACIDHDGVRCCDATFGICLGNPATCRVSNQKLVLDFYTSGRGAAHSPQSHVGTHVFCWASNDIVTVYQFVSQHLPF